LYFDKVKATNFTRRKLPKTQKRVLKNVLAFIAFVLIGSAIPALLMDDLVYYIKNTIEFFNESIQIGGKHFMFFAPVHVYVCFGISVAVLGMKLLLSTGKHVVYHLLIYVLLFSVLLTLLSGIYGWIKVINCSTCDNNIVPLHSGAIPYTELLSLCALLAMLPSCIAWILALRKR